MVNGFTTTTGSSFAFAGHQISVWELLAFGGCRAFSDKLGALVPSIISGSRCRKGPMNVTRSPTGLVGSTLIVILTDHETAFRVWRQWLSKSADLDDKLAEWMTRYVRNRWRRVTFVKLGRRDRQPGPSTTGTYQVTCNTGNNAEVTASSIKTVTYPEGQPGGGAPPKKQWIIFVKFSNTCFLVYNYTTIQSSSGYFMFTCMYSVCIVGRYVCAYIYGQ